MLFHVSTFNFLNSLKIIGEKMNNYEQVFLPLFLNFVLSKVDNCRVKLDTIENIEGSDYINASFIKGVENSYSYIGAQAPLESTVSDFIRMIWQYNVKVIICACNEYEGNKVYYKRC